MEERDRILLETRKQVPGQNGRPTQLQHVIDDQFPLRHPNWDPNTSEETQRGSDPITLGNKRADEEAKAAALRDLINLVLVTKENKQPPETLSEVTPQGKSEALAYIQQVHQLTHLGTEKLQQLLQDQRELYPLAASKRKELADSVARECQACQIINAYPTKAPNGKRLRGTQPGQFWEVDFTEIKPAKYELKYLLVFIDTFSGWVEAYPTKKQTAQVIIKKIREEIFPRFGLPKVIGSDNGPAFVAQVSQGVARILGINWKLHCVYRPQSSGQVKKKKMNRTIKETLTKLAIETGLKNWTMLLPYALFRARNTHSALLCHLTPYKILYGAPTPVKDMSSILKINSSLHTPLLDRLRALEKAQRFLWRQLSTSYQPGDNRTPHQYQVGDFIYVRRHQVQTLKPRWKGPYQVLLTTPTAVKVDGIASWIHASHLKPAPSPSESQWKLEKTDNPLKLRVRRATTSSPPSPRGTQVQPA
ncbi:LOW QUALITY PROTEIN: uncharacterized protein LOC143664385 [Tamandua tetradactyla]|uniref:LOW QUALITY PROTEIN: uncharacterized protein LOC143664385 n=1 Tax=Tamandua tetradactyla TaxID=48850 RepID=UPI004053E1A5